MWNNMRKSRVKKLKNEQMKLGAPSIKVYLKRKYAVRFHPTPFEAVK